VKCWVALAAILVVLLAVTGVLSPYLDMVWAFVSRSEPLSNPPPLWQQRLGGGPRSATIAGDTVVVEHRTLVESRSLRTGARLWETTADWAAVAGAGADAVVVIGKLLVKGYDVLDPATGAVRRRDSEAVGVWTYRNAMVDARCHDAKDCTLTAWDPHGSVPLWTVPLPGIGFVLSADNPELPDTKPLSARRVDDQAAGPGMMPPVLGFPIDGSVYLVDTAAGRVLQQLKPERDQRVAIVGGRALRITARSQDDTCYFATSAIDPDTGQEVWNNVGVNLRTTSGSGCTQRDDPAGAQNVVVGVGPDALEQVIDAYDGRILWTGLPGEKLLAVDDVVALVRGADGRSVHGAELRAGVRWNRQTDTRASAAALRYAAVVLDENPGRLYALGELSGTDLINVRSSAKVLAVGPNGIIIGDGRDIGYLPFNGTVGPGGGLVPGPGGSPLPGGGASPGSGPGPGAGCTGPKREDCPAS
jgi:outer membrane protein assembly factor BamB